jgi:hypothetical protein
MGLLMARNGMPGQEREGSLTYTHDDSCRLIQAASREYSDHDNHDNSRIEKQLLLLLCELPATLRGYLAGALERSCC